MGTFINKKPNTCPTRPPKGENPVIKCDVCNREIKNQDCFKILLRI